MSLHNKKRYIFCAATLFSMLLGNSTCGAQSVADLENLLDELQREKARQENTLNNLQNEISELPDRILEAEAELQKAEQQFAQNQEEFQALESMSQNGEDVSRYLNLQSHVVKMAARRVDSKSRSLTRVRSNRDALQSDIDAAEAIVKASDAQIAKHKQWIAEKKTEQERQRKVAEQRKITSPPLPIANIEKPLDSLSQADMDALLSAREYLNMLDEYQKNSKSASVRYENLKLSGETVRGNPTFEHIVYNQYRTETHLNSGTQSLEIGNRTFRMTGSGIQLIETGNKSFQIDVTEAAEYVVYLDGKDPTQMQLVIFKKSLMDYL